MLLTQASLIFSASTALHIAYARWNARKPFAHSLSSSSRRPLQSSESAASPQSGSLEIVRLSQKEKCSILVFNAVTTLTFLNGSISYEDVLQRWDAVVEKNPWIMGRLRLTEDCGLHLEHPPCSSPTRCKEVNQMVDFVIDPDLSMQCEYSVLCERYADHFVDRGLDMVNRDKNLARIVLIQVVEGQKYALLFSLSHVLGDGNTHYELLHMLDARRDVKALQYRRQGEIDKKMREVFHPDFAKWQASSARRWGMWMNSNWRSKPHTYIFKFNMKYIEEVKSEYRNRISRIREQDTSLCDKTQNMPQYISTNDIISSWFFNTCESEFAIMPINLRERCGIASDYAGNYVAGIVFPNSSHFEEPRNLREALLRKPLCSQRNDADADDDDDDDDDGGDGGGGGGGGGQKVAKSRQRRNATVPSAYDTFIFKNAFVSSMLLFKGICIGSAHSEESLLIGDVKNTPHRDLLLTFNLTPTEIAGVAVTRSVDLSEEKSQHPIMGERLLRG